MAAGRNRPVSLAYDHNRFATEDYLKPPLQGFRLSDGDYVPIQAVDGRLPSETLGLSLERDGKKLRFFNPETGGWLLTTSERAERAENASRTLAEEVERLRQEIENLRGGPE